MFLRNHKDKSILFGLENQKELAQKVANNLKIKVTNIDKTIFSDGEMLVKSSETVRNKKVYVICSLFSHDSIIELLLFIDSLKRASARNIVVI